MDTQLIRLTKYDIISPILFWLLLLSKLMNTIFSLKAIINGPALVVDVLAIKQ